MASAKKPKAPKPPKPPTKEPVSASSAWPRAAATPGAISPLTALDTTTHAAPEPLDLAGGEHAALRATLSAWTRQYDQSANRAARRPGGLLRLAGV